jgi:hypothetical protein
MFSEFLSLVFSQSSYDINISFRSRNPDHNIFMEILLETETLYLKYGKISLSDWHSYLSNRVLPVSRFLKWK